MARMQGWIGNRWCGKTLDLAEREETRKALSDYCGQDTLALIKLVERLQVAST
jgi:hypothetical protein